MIKKTLSLILLIIFLNTGMPAFCAQARQKVLKTGVTKNVEQKNTTKKEFTIPAITDDTAEELAKTIDKKQLKKLNYKETIINDEPILISKENQKQKKKKYEGKVSTEKGTEVLLKPLCRISTKNSNIKIKRNKGYEKQKIALPALGEQIAFKVVNDVKKGEKTIIKKGTTVYAKIGEVSPRAMGGAPAEMTIEGFEIQKENGERTPLEGTITASGYSLSLWIGVAELATTPFLIGFAVPLLRVLPGGQAKISPKKKYVVYYQN